MGKKPFVLVLFLNLGFNPDNFLVDFVTRNTLQQTFPTLRFSELGPWGLETLNH